MGLYLYAGFRTGEGHMSYAPETVEQQAEYYSVLLDYPFTEEDVQVLNEIERKAHDPELSDEMRFAWWKVYDEMPLSAVSGALASTRHLETLGIQFMGESGRTLNTEVMREVLKALDLNSEAVEYMDCMYWG